MKEKINIGLLIDADLNEKITKLAPRGTKAEALRKLLVLLLDKQVEWAKAGRREFVVDYLLRDKCKLEVMDHE